MNATPKTTEILNQTLTPTIEKNISRVYAKRLTIKTLQKEASKLEKIILKDITQIFFDINSQISALKNENPEANRKILLNSIELKTIKECDNLDLKNGSKTPFSYNRYYKDIFYILNENIKLDIKLLNYSILAKIVKYHALNNSDKYSNHESISTLIASNFSKNKLANLEKTLKAYGEHLSNFEENLTKACVSIGGVLCTNLSRLDAYLEHVDYLNNISTDETLETLDNETLDYLNNISTVA